MPRQGIPLLRLPYLLNWILTSYGAAQSGFHRVASGHPVPPAHPVKNHGECLRAEQAPRASHLPPPHDSGLPVVRWQTYARGFTRCKRHKTASPPALSGYSPAESLSECRREQPPMPATPGKEPPGVATRMPLAQKDNRRAALYSLPEPPPHDSAQQDKLPPCCPPRGAMSSATPQETTCPAPPTPRKETRGVGTRMPFAQKDNSMLAVDCHPFTWTNSRQGKAVTIHTRNRPG